MFLSFPIKLYVNLEKLIRFHRQAFIMYENGENLKILKEMFCQKLWSLTLFWLFQTISSLKFYWSGNHVGRHRGLPVFQNPWIRSCQHWCFPLHVSKFLRTPILKNISERLLLIILLRQQFICFRMSPYNCKEKQ